MLSLLLCACLSILMLLAADALSFSLGRVGWRRFASTFLLFYSQIVVTEFMLGLVSILYGPVLFLFNAALSGLLLYVLHKKFGKKTFKKYLSNIMSLPGEFKGTARSDRLWSVLLVLAGIIISWVIFLGIIFPATDYDGNSYHLTFTANVIQNHNFYDPATSLTWLAGYPKGGEFIQMWSAIITHNDMFTDLAQMPFLFLGVYALYSIALAIGAEKKNARFASLLFLFLPIVINQLKTTYVDVMLCSLFFAGLAMVIRKKLDKLDLLLIGIVFSLLISVKSTGFLFVLVLLPILFWNLYQSYGKKLKEYLQPLVLLMLPTFFGLYWYFKDWILYHSPIYPFGFKLAGLTIFPGKTFQQFSADAITQTSLPHSGLARIWYVWTEQKDWFGCLYNYDTNYAGLGPIWFIILIPAFITALYIAIRRRNLLLLSVMATIAFLFLIYPSDYYSRYTMFVSSLGIISLGYIFGSLSGLGERTIKLLAIVLALSVIGTNFVLCNFTPGTVRAQLKSVIDGSQRGAIYASMPGRAFVFIENKEQPGDVTAYSSNPFFIFPIWKPDFSNQVVFVKASGESGWYQGLGDKHVKYVFATLNSKEKTWADDRLKSIYKDDMYEIYQTN